MKQYLALAILLITGSLMAMNHYQEEHLHEKNIKKDQFLRNQKCKTTQKHKNDKKRSKPKGANRRNQKST